MAHSMSSYAKQCWKGLWGEGQLCDRFLREGVFVLLAKTLSKVFLFGFVLLVARYLSQEEFGDFQFVCAIINVVSQPGVTISIIVARIGCSFEADSCPYNLRWFVKRMGLHFGFAFLAVILLFSVMHPWLGKVGRIGDSRSFAIAGVTISATFAFNLFVGVLQTLERYYAIGSLFLLIGVLNLALGSMIGYFDLGILSTYGVQALAIGLVLIFAGYIVRRVLPRNAIAPVLRSFSIPRFSVFALLSMGMFFVLFNMDVVVVKVVFDRSTAGYYARIAFFGKTCFLLASSFAVILFPKVSKAYERGGDPAGYLAKVTRSYLVVACLVLPLVMLMSTYGSRFVFGAGFSIDRRMLLLILCAGVCQSYVFMLLNYGIAVMERGVVYFMLGILAIQVGAFVFNHATLLQVSANMLIPSGIGATLLLLHFYSYQVKKSGRDEHRTVSSSPNL